MTRFGLSFAALAAPAALAVALGLSAVAPGTPAPGVPQADRVRVAEAFRLAERMGDAIWPGWARVPFALVLVTPDTEFFIRHPSPPSDARPIGTDPMLGSEIFARPRTFPTSFLATFPIDGVSTVVVGQAESTATSSPADWVVTLLHEHFHQLQESPPGFYEKVAALGLARGDTTGMWMLNFPFPYEARPVSDAYRSAAPSRSRHSPARCRPRFPTTCRDSPCRRPAGRSSIRTARRRRCSSTASGPAGRISTSRGCSRSRRASTRRIAEGKPGARG